VKVLTTGASGRVGTNLVKALVERGHTVRAFLYPGDAARLAKLNHFDVETVTGDLRNMTDVVRAVQGMETIFHIGGAMIGPFDNEAYFDINAKGTFNVVEAARLHAPNLQRLVYASTDAVYPMFPDTEPGLIAREELPAKPEGLYSLSKWIGERLCLAYHQQYGLPAVAFRFAWVIGAGEILDSSYLRAIWLSKVLASYRSQDGQTPESQSVVAVLERLWSGEEKLVFCRSAAGMAEAKHFVDVRDLLQGLLLGMEKPEAIGEVFNLPGPKMLSFAEVVPYAAERLKMPFVEARLPISLQYREMSWDKAQRILGYTPRHGLESMVDLALAMRRGEEVDLIPTGIPYSAA
jgi:UDP-glucose 4-epimerase